MTSETTSTVLRVVRVLQGIAEVGGGAGVSGKELSTRLGLPTSTVHRLLKLLKEPGLVEQGAVTQRYRAGRELFRIASLVTRQVDLTDIATPFLAEMLQESQETCYFTLYLPASRTFTGAVILRSPHPLQYHIEPFTQGKLAWGAVGRSILAHLPQGEIDKALAEAGPSPEGDPPPGPAEMAAILDEIRTRGYAIAINQVFPDAIGFARAVFDGDGAVVGSLGITMPLIRYNPSMEPALSALVMRQAKRVSTALGAREPR